MDLLEIDPKLFITCRLCLEDNGIYQIVPTVQQQIKFCFDIDVQPFDGLPQLLCKKCHTLLSEFSMVKKTYNEKQITLREKLMLKKREPSEAEPVVTESNKANVSAHNEDNVSDNHDANNEINGTSHGEEYTSGYDEVNKSLNKKFSKSKKRRRLLSGSSTESANSTTTKRKKGRKVTPNTSSTRALAAWKKKYTKYFVCKICSLMYKDKKSIQSHYNAHSYIRARHHEIFDLKCTVNLSKMDNKPNITGLNNTVVFSKNRIIQADHSDLYHILYIAKSKHYSKSDSSDCETFTTNKRRKRRRLDSLSSNETVFIGNSNKSTETFDTKVTNKTTQPQKQENESKYASKDSPICIDLDESSDSNMGEANKLVKPIENALPVDMKTIEHILTVCRNKFETRLKKTQSAENEITRAHKDSQLKHKLLSFGRKTINAKGFNSTGLLRYLEHKNLNVIWDPVAPKKAQSVNRESFVRVGAVMMNREQRGDDDAGWTDVVDSTLKNELPNNVNENVPEVSNTATLNIIPAGMTVLITSPESDGVNQIVLSDIRSIEETNSQKLLNVNPVANPKQLPKKAHTHDVKQSQIKLHNNFDQNPVNSGEQLNEPNMVMPVITSTKSLATEMYNKPKNNDFETANNSATDKTYPRIKVKSVTELMKPQNLNTQKTEPLNHTVIWNYNPIQNGTAVLDNAVNLFVPNMLIPQIQSQSTPPLSAGSSTIETVETTKNNTDYIILDTVDMPNTKTESPFEYFRNLMQLHDLVLIEANSNISREFICLLKFKVQFKQENKNNPVTLCLSLHCAGNKFCMSIRDGNHINIHIAKMSANWQWEIIKVYQGDVSSKILLNAQKAGQSVYTNTNTFICLLKSITHKQE